MKQVHLFRRHRHKTKKSVERLPLLCNHGNSSLKMQHHQTPPPSPNACSEQGGCALFTWSAQPSTIFCHISKVFSSGGGSFFSPPLIRHRRDAAAVRERGKARRAMRLATGTDVGLFGSQRMIQLEGRRHN
ncbi:hypothetical protein NQZ68_012147 [Dissostichus eleginoides]|nr:hypothetical protein NQZ68_012147 [Dissostichus eleginoides]